MPSVYLYVFLAFLAVFALVIGLDFLDKNETIYKKLHIEKHAKATLFAIFKMSFISLILIAVVGLSLLALGYGDSFTKFADFVGGTLGPILSFFSLVIISISLQMQINSQERSEAKQDEQLKLSREQKNDDFFYLILERWRRSAENIEYPSNGINLTGPRALEAILSEAILNTTTPKSIIPSSFSEEKQWQDDVNNMFADMHDLFEDRISFLFTYFSSFCRLLDFIDSSYSSEVNKTERYIKIAQSHMSLAEVYLIYLLSATRAFGECDAIGILNKSSSFERFNEKLPYKIKIAVINSNFNGGSHWYSPF